MGGSSVIVVHSDARAEIFKVQKITFLDYTGMLQIDYNQSTTVPTYCLQRRLPRSLVGLRLGYQIDIPLFIILGSEFRWENFSETCF